MGLATELFGEADFQIQLRDKKDICVALDSDGRDCARIFGRERAYFANIRNSRTIRKKYSIESEERENRNYLNPSIICVRLPARACFTIENSSQVRLVFASLLRTIEPKCRGYPQMEVATVLFETMGVTIS
jgi:hypothetical protein